MLTSIPFYESHQRVEPVGRRQSCDGDVLLFETVPFKPTCSKKEGHDLHRVEGLSEDFGVEGGSCEVEEGGVGDVRELDGGEGEREVCVPG